MEKHLRELRTCEKQEMRYPRLRSSTELQFPEEVDGKFQYSTLRDEKHSTRTTTIVYFRCEGHNAFKEGFAECWGISVLTLPILSWLRSEKKTKTTGILANGEMAFELARLMNHWTKDLEVFTMGP